MFEVPLKIHGIYHHYIRIKKKIEFSYFMIYHIQSTDSKLFILNVLLTLLSSFGFLRINKDILFDVTKKKKNISVRNPLE